MQYVITVLAIVGVVFNIFKRPESFIIWTFTNAYWICHNYKIGEYEQACLFGAMMGLSIFGAVKWYCTTKDTKNHEEKPSYKECQRCQLNACWTAEKD